MKFKSYSEDCSIWYLGHVQVRRIVWQMLQPTWLYIIITHTHVHTHTHTQNAGICTPTHAGRGIHRIILYTFPAADTDVAGDGTSTHAQVKTNRQARKIYTRSMHVWCLYTHMGQRDGLIRAKEGWYGKIFSWHMPAYGQNLTVQCTSTASQPRASVRHTRSPVTSRGDWTPQALHSCQGTHEKVCQIVQQRTEQPDSSNCHGQHLAASILQLGQTKHRSQYDGI